MITAQQRTYLLLAGLSPADLRSLEVNALVGQKVRSGLAHGEYSAVIRIFNHPKISTIINETAAELTDDQVTILKGLLS